MTSDNLTCKEFVELVTDYFEGTLPAAQRYRFDAHLATCGDCTIYLAQMRKTVQLVGKLTENDFDAKAKDKFLQIFRDWKKSI
jgi:anti-sigma factor RsiW